MSDSINLPDGEISPATGKPSASEKRPRVLSGMRPTGRLHIGHYFGALQNWVKMQETHDCFYCVVDWHALTTHYEDTGSIAQNVLEVATDWLAVGLDPERATLFLQSSVLEHAELHLLLSMVTPLSWLERVPTYKEQIENLRERDLGTYGFLGYPLLQTADIVLYGEPDRVIEVPVGEDQVPHVELAREVVRRFNTQFGFEVRIPAGKATDTVRLLEKVGVKQSAIDAAAGHDERIVLFRKRALEIGMANFFGELGEDKKYFRVGQVLREPDVKLTETPRLPGTDGRRMAKSYGNAIWLSEPVEEIRKKVRNMLTDPQRVRRTDPGRPEICPVFYYHKVFSPAETVAEVDRDCRTAGIGCVDCKGKMADGLVRWIEPIQARRKEFEGHPGRVWDILDAGSKKAGVTAKRTMKRVRDAIFDWDSVRAGR